MVKSENTNPTYSNPGTRVVCMHICEVFYDDWILLLVQCFAESLQWVLTSLFGSLLRHYSEGLTSMHATAQYDAGAYVASVTCGYK